MHKTGQEINETRNRSSEVHPLDNDPSRQRGHQHPLSTLGRDVGGDPLDVGLLSGLIDSLNLLGGEVDVRDLEVGLDALRFGRGSKRDTRLG